MAKSKKVVTLDPIEELPTEADVEFYGVDISEETPLEAFGDAKEPVVEVKADTEEDQKARYEVYLEQNKEQISTLVSTYANMFAGMGNGSLAGLATGTDMSSISRNPKIADALLFELGKRKLKKEAEDLAKRLAEMPWYATPWLGF